MPTFDECIKQALELVEAYGEDILKATIYTAHGLIEIKLTGNHYELKEIEE